MPNETGSRKIPVEAPKYATENELRFRSRASSQSRMPAAKVTGRRRFADDIFLPRMAHQLLRVSSSSCAAFEKSPSRAAAHP